VRNITDLDIIFKSKRALQNLIQLLSTKTDSSILLLVLHILQLLSSRGALVQILRPLDILQKAGSLTKSMELNAEIREAASSVLASLK